MPTTASWAIGRPFRAQCFVNEKPRACATGLYIGRPFMPKCPQLAMTFLARTIFTPLSISFEAQSNVIEYHLRDRDLDQLN